MFEQLQNRFQSIVKTLKGHGKITDVNINEAAREIRRALLEADVHFKVAKEFIQQVQEKAQGEKVLKSVSPGQQFMKILHDELVQFLGENAESVRLNKNGQSVILMAGLQGSGKTTTSAKLARYLKNDCKRNPLLIAADMQRPGAVEQLKILGKQVVIEVFSETNKTACDIVKAGLDYARSSKFNIVIIDTAGRLHIDDISMAELKQIYKLSSPDETFFVVDGMTGQDAVNSSKEFDNEIDLTGVILTKMDGDTRGGAALSIRKITGKPIKFIGTGEGLDGLETFHPDRLAKRILGMGDVISFVEKAQQNLDLEETEKLTEKLLKQQFTLGDFQAQLKQIQKMGSISQIIKMIPGMNKIPVGDADEKQLVWIDAMINSMTVKERNHPNIINGSRRKRIAKGSGRSLFEVNQLLKQFFQMKKMMAGFSKNKFKGLPFKL